MLRFRFSEKPQTHTKSMQQKNKLIQKDTLHAKQSQVTKSQNDFPK